MMLNSFSFVLSSPGPIALHIGSLNIRWYGILIAVAFLIAYSLTEKLILNDKLNINHFNDLIFFVLISSVIGARLYFVLLSWDYFKEHLSEIPKIWLGGQSIHGGMIGAILATIIYTKIKKISFYNYIDVIATVTPLGQAIGRWGNFFNNEAFGRPASNSLIKLFIPQEYRPDSYINQSYFHPTFLYESILNFVIFVFLYKKYPKWRKNPGKIFWTYLICYSAIRFLLEFLRTDSLYLFNFPCAQIISIIIFVIAGIFLFQQEFSQRN